MKKMPDSNLKDTLNYKGNISVLLDKTVSPLTLDEISKITDIPINDTNTVLNNLLKENSIITKGYASNRIYIGNKNSFKGERKKFSDINNSDDLIYYLCDYRNRIKDDVMINHYTTFNVLNSIIESKFWYLGNCKNMNDQWEKKNFPDVMWEKLFFSSFMISSKESIGMWAMYTPKWTNGVMISIPGSIFKRWIKDIIKVYSANPETKKVNKDMFLLKSDVMIRSQCVCYYDDVSGVISYGTNQNTSILNPYRYSDLTGFIKDEAWSYEKEVRLRIELKEDMFDFKALAIEIPDYVFENMTVTKSPLFDNKNIINFKTKESFFTHKLNIKLD